MQNPNDEKFLYSMGARMGGPRRPSGLGEIAGQVNWTLFAGFIAVLVVALYACHFAPYLGIATFVFVLVGWLFSLTLHEFSHAAVAFLSGDRSSSTRRYLSGNPLNYLHPVLSIVLPLVFILLGGFALPGGAVYLQSGLIRSPGRRSAVSAAGPAANLVCLVLLAVLYQLGLRLGFLGFGALAAVACLAFFQGIALLLNLIPIPGLDGYGIIEPFLSYQLRQTFEAIRPYGFIIIFVLFFFVQPFRDAFFATVDALLAAVHIDPVLRDIGYQNFYFWRR